MRCKYIRAVGATLLQYVSVLPELKSIAVGASITRPFVTVLPALTGRADAINVSAQFECATKCLPLAELEGKVSPLVTDEVLSNLRC